MEQQADDVMVSDQHDDFDDDQVKKQEIMQNLQQLNLLANSHQKTHSSRSEAFSDSQSHNKSHDSPGAKHQRGHSPLKEPSISDDSIEV